MKYIKGLKEIKDSLNDGRTTVSKINILLQILKI